jgi:hypothetical protein
LESPVLELSDLAELTTAMVCRETDRDLDAAGARIEAAASVYLVFDDGAVTIEPPSSRQVDCHISADPTTLFLLFWSRTRQWPAALSGRLRVWGRRPWLGIQLPRMLPSP